MLSANQKSVTQFGWGNGPMGMDTWTTAESSLSHWQKIRKISEEILVTHFQNFAKFNLIYILIVWVILVHLKEVLRKVKGCHNLITPVYMLFSTIFCEMPACPVIYRSPRLDKHANYCSALKTLHRHICSSIWYIMNKKHIRLVSAFKS